MSEQEYAFKGIWIPAEIFLAEDLNPTEILLLAEIIALDGEDGCFASNAHFAKRFKVTQKYVSRVINMLVSKNYITSDIVWKNGKVDKRIIRSATPSHNSGIPLPQSVDTPLPQKGEGKEQVLKNNLIVCNPQTEKPDVASRKFTKPTVQQVRDYCIERQNNVDANRFVDFYESKGWLVGKSKMKCWKSAVRNWERTSKTSTTKEQRYAELDHAINDYETAKYNW